MRYKVKDLAVLKEFGFMKNDKYISPKYVTRQVDEHQVLMVSISSPCINVWDGEDKNHSGEIELVNDKGFGTYKCEDVEEYITDLIDAGVVEVL